MKTNKLEKLRTLLEKYQNLFFRIGECNLDMCGGGDVALDGVIDYDPENYYGCDISGEQQLWMCCKNKITRSIQKIHRHICYFKKRFIRLGFV
jgi:hypothetical protein